jgi:hypothetical protein
MAASKRRAFSDGDKLEYQLSLYLDHCKEIRRYPNIAGFCVFAGISRETYYQQQNYYPDTYKRIQLILEDEAINSPYADKVMKIFYLKNKFGYSDKIETNVNTTSEIKLNLSNLTEEELIQLKELTWKLENDTAAN